MVQQTEFPIWANAGLEVLGGIFLKLESTCLNGFFSATGISLKACEVEAMNDVEVEDEDA